MEGLLDFVKTPEGQGLLTAAFGGLATAGRGGPVNTLGAMGLSGMAGYSAASANALKRQQEALLRAQRQALPTLYGKDAEGNNTFDWKAAGELGFSPDDIVKYAQLPRAVKGKVARTVEVPGADGSKQTAQYDEYGDAVGSPIASYVAPQVVDLGNEKRFVTPTAGQAFAVGMSPAELATDARGWANVATQRQNNAILHDANNINKEAQRVQIVTGADGTVYRVDKGTGEATPAVMPGGAPVQSGPLAEATVKNQKNAVKLGEFINQAREALPNSTASGLGTKADEANRFFGHTTTGAQAAAKLGVIGGNMVMLMPRMEGPQSNVDVENYKTMAGRVGDPTIPAAERMAALDALEEIIGRYSGQPQASAPKQESPMPQAGTFADPDKEARYQEFKRRQGQ